MNDLYIRDRMERNKQDYEGSGVGSGRYDRRAEQIEKWNNLKLPLALGAVLIVAWVLLFRISIPEFEFARTATKVTVPVQEISRYGGQTTVKWKAPDGRNYTADIRNAKVKDEQVDIYYLGEDYENAKGLTPITDWVLFYGFCIICTAALGVWMVKILYTKSRAVPKQKEHSYKDY